MSKAEHPPGGLPPQEETDEVTVLHGGPQPPGTPRPGATLPLPGQLLAGRYAVLSTLGQGGMGVVLAAYDSRLDRRVALKLLSPSRAVGGSNSPLQARLQREAQAMARLNHPHVVTVFDVGSLEDGSVFIAMEYVQGQTLRQWAALEPRPWREILRVYVAAGRGLAAAHAAGLVHRDFKPDNVLVGEDGRVRVTDFGVARADQVPTEELPKPPQPLEFPELGDNQLTQSGVMVGTPRYLAPEVLAGEPADARSDLFAWCVALYEALYDQPAFEGLGLAERTQAQRKGLVTPLPADSPVPEWVGRAVLQGLSASPQQRPSSMLELLARLEDDPELRRQAQRRRLSRGAGVAALGALLLAGGAFAWWQNHTACARMGGRLAKVWDEQVRTRVRSALVGTGLPYAQATAERVEAALDAYARDWVALRTQACEASREVASQRELPVLQVYCLERRRGELRALTEVLSHGADKAPVDKAMQAVLALPPLAYCADERALTAAVPPPEDPRLRARAEALQEQVDRLAALYEAGRYKQGLEQGEPLLAQVAEVDWAPLQAQAHYQLARLRQGAGDYKGAEAQAREAIALAARGKDDTLAAQAWLQLLFVVGERQERHAEALGMELAARSWVERSGDERTRLTLLGDVGLIYYRLGEYERAYTQLHHVLEERQRLLGPEHPEVTIALNNLGLVLGDMGRYEEACATLEQALALKRKVLGPEHPDVARTLNNLAATYAQMQQYEQALPYCEQVLELQRRLRGPEHPEVATALNNLAAVLLMLGRHAQAQGYYEQALAVRRKVLGPEHPEVGRALSRVGLVLAEQGHHEQARTRYEQALELQQRVQGPEHPEVAATLAALGQALIRLGQWDTAERHLRRSLELCEKAPRKEPPGMTDALLGLGELSLARGRPAEAIPLLERALKLEELRLHPRVQLTLAQALWDSGRERARALELARQAQAYYQRFHHAPGLARASQWLAAHAHSTPE